MTVKIGIAILGAVGLICGFGEPADATTVVATYTGIVTAGHDSAGVFGSPVAFDGQAFTATYTYDVSSIYGGSASAFLFSGLTATLTINGVAIDFSGSAVQGASSNNFFATGGGDSLRHYISDWSDTFAGSVRSQISNYSTGFLDGANLTGPYDYTPVAGDDALGSFDISLNGEFAATGNLLTTRVSIGPEAVPESPVPEPASWAMMICGFGMIGATSRRRRPFGRRGGSFA